MKFVLDNSVIMRWFFEDGSRSDLAYADNVLASMTGSNAIVPAMSGLEVADVLSRAEAHGQVTKDENGIFIEMLRDLHSEFDTTRPISNWPSVKISLWPRSTTA